MKLEALAKLLIREPDSEYHKGRETHVTSHSLATFVRSPKLYRDAQLGLLSGDDSEAFAFGRALHVRTLEGKAAFEAQFACGGPINPKTGEAYGSRTKAYAQWVASIGKPAVTHEEAVTIEMMSAAVHSHPIASAILDSGIAEGVIRQNLATRYGEIACQSRLDWLYCDDIGIHYADLKSTHNLDSFESQIVEYGYANQMGFYARMIRDRVRGRDRLSPHVTASLIAVEKEYPYRVAVYRIQARELALRVADVDHNLDRLALCARDCQWPTGTEELRHWPAA